MEQDKQKLKILWSSNAQYAPTGYGTVTGNLVYPLLYEGYDVRVAANWGLEGRTMNFREYEREVQYKAQTGKEPIFTDLTTYPRMWSEYGEDALYNIIGNFQPDVLVTLYDVWIGANSRVLGKDWFKQLHNRWIAYAPIDHDPAPDPVIQQLSLAYKQVAMSQFGYNEMKRCGMKPYYIPHGVDTVQYSPMDKAEAKKWRAKRSAAFVTKDEGAVPITPETFCVGINAANKDPFRKDFARMFIAFQMFLDENPDAKKDAILDVHTWVKFPNGFDLKHLALKLGIAKNVRHTYTYDMLCGLPTQKMNIINNSWDVYMNLCRGGGFELGHIETASSGVPSIGVDFTSMPELIRGHGWLVQPYAGDIECPHCKKGFSYNGGAKQFSHLMSLYCIPDEYAACEAIEDAYNHPKKTAKLGADSRKFALDYDYNTKIVPKWLDLFDEVRSELGMLGVNEDKQKGYDDLYKELTQ